MKKRVIVGIILTLYFIPVVVIPQLFYLCLASISFLACFAVFEMVRMFENEVKFPGITKLVTLALGALNFACFVSCGWLSLKNGNTNNYLLVLLPVVLLEFSIIIVMGIIYQEYDANMISKSLLAIMYPSLGFSSLFLIRLLGTPLILYLFSITIFTDTFAYFFGIKFGRHKLCPNISPKKSVEGAIWGLVFGSSIGTIIGIFVPRLFGFNNIIDVVAPNNNLNEVLIIFIIIIISILSSVCGQIGDLIASKFKRTYDIKDYSQIFPGHGGVLDRFDSAIFVGILQASIYILLFFFLV